MRNSADIIDMAREIGWQRPMKLGVAAANDPDVLEAVIAARSENMIEPVLVGSKSAIEELAGKLKLDLDGVEIVDAPKDFDAAVKISRMAADKEIQIIMKGFIQTSILLKTILKPAYNLRMQETMSHCAVLSIPGYHKLLNITDGGMVIEPTLEQKLAIIKNAVLVANSLGISRPKVALHSASDYINPAMRSTLDAAIISKMAQRKQIEDADIDGPLTIDCALRPATAKYAGIESLVAGDADALIVNSIEEGNIISKALVHYIGAVFSGVVVGATVPISLVSRTDSSYNKKASIALAVVLADYI
ncbi:MAG: bifunctional enoyl-CoA hydratase/phosphate acetyltransferase, partial [FCB group bacterium]|nr:bifunctional enoyl-CoA hydratase/phosphate acetyltransferase [FCB group bacterium]